MAAKQEASAPKQVQYEVIKVFGVDPFPEKPGALVRGYETSTEFVPDLIDPFAFVPKVLRALMAARSLKRPLRIHGPRGCGKSEHAEQFCARLNLPVVKFACHNQVEITDLLGSWLLVEGKMVWQDGPLTIAARNGYVFILEEDDALNPGLRLVMQDIVRGKPLVLAAKGGEVIKPREGFWVIATSNTRGAGNESGDHHGVVHQNKASLERFYHYEMDYLEMEVEEGLLSRKYPKFPDEQVVEFVAFANAIRKLYKEAKVEDPLSTRVLMDWIDAMIVLGDAREAFDLAHGGGVSETDRKTLDEQWSLIIEGKAQKKKTP